MKVNKSSSLCSLVRKIPLAGLLLGMGIFMSRVMPAIAAATQIEALRGRLPQQDGVYLYGKAPQPQQLGQEYMVFELHRGKVTGAFYLPYSEFSCFSGNINSGELALMVANAPDVEEPVTQSNPQQIAAVIDKPRMGEEFEAIAYPYAVALQEYYQLPQVSNSDRQILQTCKNQYPN